MDIKVLQSQIGRWTASAWKDGFTLERTLNLLEQEVLDLGEVLHTGTKEAQEEQVAAILLTLLSLAELQKMDLGHRATRRYLTTLLRMPPEVVDEIDRSRGDS